MTDVERYNKGLYVWPRPYPCTSGWSIQDHINYININNLWTYQECEFVQKP